MSRTLRRTPIYPVASGCSEAWDKRRWHKALRSRERRRLAALCAPYDGFIPLHRNAILTTWDMAKDGKYWDSWRNQREFAHELARYDYGWRPPAEITASIARQVARGRFR